MSRRAGVILACLAAWWLYGAHVLAPGSVAWLLHGDPAQHYVGSTSFLSQPWRWPPGAIHGFGELPTSVVFVDAIPGVALLAKALALPPGLQYFGVWMLLCHALSAWFGMRLLTRLGASGWGLCAGGMLFSFAPALLLRLYGHEALMAHFLVLAALERSLGAWRWDHWVLLGVCGVLVHPYLALMVCVLGVASAMAAVAGRELAWKALAMQALAGAAALLACAWLVGYFVGGAQVSSAGHGFFSANLLTWADPMDWHAFLAQNGRDVSRGASWSRLLPAQTQATGGQYEGFAYLGAGVLLASALACVPMGRARIDGPGIDRRRWIATVAACIVLGLLALSAQPSVGGRIVAAIPLSDGVASALGVFRASGRFIWPLTYLLMAVVLSRVLRLPNGSLLLSACLVLQAFDLSAKLSEFRHRFRDGPEGIVAQVASPTWGQALGRCPKMELLGGPDLGTGWIAPALAAARAGARVLPAPTARLSDAQVKARQVAVMRLLEEQRWQQDTVYVLLPGLPRAPAAVPAGWRRQALDGYDTVIPLRCMAS